MASYEFTGKSIQEAVRQAAQSLNVAEDDFTFEVLEKPTKGFLGFGGKDGRIRVTLKQESFDVQELFNTETPSPEKNEPPQIPMEEAIQESKSEEDLLQPEASTPKTSAVEMETELEVVEAPTIVEDEEDDLAHVPINPAEAELFTEELEQSLDPIEDVAIRFLSPIFEALETNPVVEVEENDREILFKVDGDHVGLLIGRRGETLRALQLLLSVAVHREVKSNKRILLDVADYKARRAESLENLAIRMADKARKTGRKVRLDPMNPAERRLVHLALEKEKGLTTYSEGKDPYRRIVILPEDA